MQAIATSNLLLAEHLHRVWAHILRSSGGGYLAEIERIGLSLTQLKMLNLLGEADGISGKQVAETLGLSTPAVSRALDGLAQRGLVERTECAHDRRSRLLSLTDTGRDVLNTVEEARLAGLAQFADSLPDSERDALVAALSPIVKRISP